MKTVYWLTKRNCKLFFKDKGMFFSSLITPIILLFCTQPFWQRSTATALYRLFPGV